MLTREKLVELYREFRDVGVLSVYVDGGQTDPAERRVWTKELELGLDAQRRRLETESPDDLEAFDAASERVVAVLDQYKAFLPERGWIAFATGDGLPYAEGVPVPMPNLVRWERGLRVAPYVRALKQQRVVVTVLADRRKARIFTYRDGEATEHEEVTADLDFGDLSESGSSRRAGGHTGSRGETGTDAGQRSLDGSAAQLQARVLDVARGLAGSDGFLILGGTPEVVAALARHTESLDGRTLERPSMHLGMTVAEVKAAIEESASELSRRMQDTLLDTVIDSGASGGRGCLGIEATSQALRDARVDSLLITRSLRERDPDLADHLVGTAFEQNAAVEELSAVGADRLDSVGEGVGARLRYTV